MSALFQPVKTQVFKDMSLAPGAVVYFYEAGTSTPKAVYADADLSTSLGTSVTADANGDLPAIYLTSASEAYKYRIETASGELIDEQDDFRGVGVLGGPTVSNMSSVSDLKAYDASPGSQIMLYESGKSGSGVVKSGTPPSDPLEGVYVVLDNGNYWERTGFTEALASWWGATDGGTNSSAVQAMLDFCSGKPYTAVINVDSELAGITVPDSVKVVQRANITMPTGGSTDCFTVTEKENVTLDGNRHGGYTVTKSGAARFLTITAISDYANKNIRVKRFDVSGGTGQAINWFGCDDIEFEDNNLHDFNATGIQSTSNTISNPYRSRKVSFLKNKMKNLTEGGTGNTCHGISINSWLYVDDVWLDKNDIDNTSNNPIEIWANYVFCSRNKANDGVISFSFGACHYLHCVDNMATITTPATSGPGAYGIEAGGVVHYTIRGNIVRGHRNGIRMTGSNVTGGEDWYTGTDLYSEEATLDPADTKQLRILNSDLAGTLSGSYIGVIANNLMEDCLDSAIYVSQDYTVNDTVLVDGNKAVRTGRYDTPSSVLAALYFRNCKAFVTGNTVYDSLYYAIYAFNSEIILGVNHCEKVDTAKVIDHVGLLSSVRFLCHQAIDRCQVDGLLAGEEPTKGTWRNGWKLPKHEAVAGGTEGRICVQSGTNSTQLNSLTANTTSGSTTVTLSPSVGDAMIGVFITIAGVSGVKEIVDVDESANTVEIDVAADATVSGAAVTNSPAVFKVYGSIAA